MKVQVKCISFKKKFENSPYISSNMHTGLNPQNKIILMDYIIETFSFLYSVLVHFLYDFYWQLSSSFYNTSIV